MKAAQNASSMIMLERHTIKFQLVYIYTIQISINLYLIALNSNIL